MSPLARLPGSTARFGDLLEPHWSRSTLYSARACLASGGDLADTLTRPLSRPWQSVPETLLTVITNLRQQKRAPLTALTAAIEARFQGRPTRSLLPEV